MAKGSINWDEQPLGEVPDEDLARALGVTRQAVAKQRNAPHRRIAPCAKVSAASLRALTKLEREDLAGLEAAVVQVLDPTRDLSASAAETVGRTPGWTSEAQRPLRAHAPGRFTAFRFRAPGRRNASSWMTPAAARRWLVDAGWVDDAEKRIGDLRSRAQRKDEVHRVGT